MPPCPALPLGTHLHQHRKTTISGEEAALHRSSMSSAEFTEIIVISCLRTESPTSPDLRNRPSQKVCLIIKKRKAELHWTLFSFLKFYCLKFV